MAARRRPRRLRGMKLTKRQLEAERKKRERALSVGAQVAAHILSDPNAMKGIGMVLEAVGRALQSTATGVKEQGKPKALPGDVLDLSTFRKEKKPDG